MWRVLEFGLRSLLPLALCLVCTAPAASEIPERPLAGAAGMSAVRSPAAAGAAINDDVAEPGAAWRPAAAWLQSQGLRRGAPAAVSAATAVAPGGLVGTNFPICDHHEIVSTTESLDASSAAYNPVRGEYLVVWHAVDRVTQANVYGQRVAANGNAVGFTFVICNAPGVQAAPSVTYDPGTGVFWVAWTDFRNGAGDVYLRRVSAVGELLGSEFVANDGPADAFAARVACGTGVCAVVWASDPHDGNTHVLLRAWAPVTLTQLSFVLLSSATGHVTEPDICYNGDDARFMVVWQQVNASMQWDVWSYHLTWDIYGIEQKPISTAVYHQQKPRVAYSHGAGRYLVVWEDSRSNVSWDVYGRRLERGGAFAGGDQAIFAGPYRDIAPVVAGHDGAASEFIVAFQRDISGALQDQIYACRVSGNGAVSGAFPVREWYNVRSRPAIAHRNGQDDYIVTFTEDAYGTQPDVDAQIVRGNAVLVGSPLAVSRGRKGQEAPTVAYNSARNEYLPVWADFRDGHDYDLYYWRLAPSGVGIGPGLILATASSLYGDPHATYNPAANEYLVVWSEVTSPSSGFEIYGRRLDGTGAQLGVPILVSRDTASFNEGRPRALFNPASGEYLVVWHAFTGGVWRIWGQRLAAGGALVGGNFPISDGAGLAQNPRVALDPAANEAVVVWQDVRNSRIDVYAERVSAAGATVGGNYPVSTATGDKDRCDIAYDGAAAGYLVVWGDTRSGGADVWAQRLDAAGAVAGAPFAVIESAVFEVAPSVAWDVGSHEFLVTWWALDQSTDYDIWARRVPGAGLPSVPSFPVSCAMEVQSRADLVQNTNTTEFLVFWQDFRNGTYDIFGQRWMKLPRARLHHGVPGHDVVP